VLLQQPSRSSGGLLGGRPIRSSMCPQPLQFVKPWAMDAAVHLSQTLPITRWNVLAYPVPRGSPGIRAAARPRARATRPMTAAGSSRICRQVTRMTRIPRAASSASRMRSASNRSREAWKANPSTSRARPAPLQRKSSS